LLWQLLLDKHIPLLSVVVVLEQQPQPNQTMVQILSLLQFSQRVAVAVVVTMWLWMNLDEQGGLAVAVDQILVQEALETRNSEVHHKVITAGQVETREEVAAAGRVE
jgi:hypothetical protein